MGINGLPASSSQSVRPCRWPRRLAITMLVTLITGLVLLAGFSCWVYFETMPVVVVDGSGKPVGGVAVFDMDAASEACRSIRTAGPSWGVGFGPVFCVALEPEAAAAQASSVRLWQNGPTSRP